MLKSSPTASSMAAAPSPAMTSSIPMPSSPMEIPIAAPLSHVTASSIPMPSSPMAIPIAAPLSHATTSSIPMPFSPMAIPIATSLSHATASLIATPPLNGFNDSHASHFHGFNNRHAPMPSQGSTQQLRPTRLPSLSNPHDTIRQSNPIAHQESQHRHPSCDNHPSGYQHAS